MSMNDDFSSGGGGFEFETPTNIDSGGTFIDKPGTYLLKSIKCRPNENVKGEPEDGTLCVDCVVAGAAPENADQVTKTTTVSARRPRLNDNSPDFQKKKLARLGIALGQMTAADLQKGRVVLNPATMVGRYFVAIYDWNEYQGKKSVRLSFADIYHLDDLKAEGAHLDAAIIGTIPQDQRADPKELAKCYTDPHSEGGMREIKPTQGGGSLFDSL